MSTKRKLEQVSKDEKVIKEEIKKEEETKKIIKQEEKKEEFGDDTCFCLTLTTIHATGNGFESKSNYFPKSGVLAKEITKKEKETEKKEEKKQIIKQEEVQKKNQLTEEDEKDLDKFLAEEEKGLTDDTCFCLTLTTTDPVGATSDDHDISHEDAAAFYVCLHAGFKFVFDEEAFTHNNHHAYNVRKLNVKTGDLKLFQIEDDIRGSTGTATIEEERFRMGVFNYELVKKLSLSKAKEMCIEFGFKHEDRLLLEALCMWDVEINDKYGKTLNTVGYLCNYQGKRLKELKKSIGRKSEGTEEDE